MTYNADSVSGITTTGGYDANGNLATKTQGGTVTDAYEYDGFGRLVKVTKGTTVITYKYNGDGQRMSKTISCNSQLVTCNYLWDGDQIIWEKTGSEPAVRYIRGLMLEYRIWGNTRHYYRYNTHGDVIESILSWGLCYYYRYDAFGNQLNIDPNDTNPFRYCGEYYDAETGFIYLRNRYYDPAIGRFISEDPIQSGLNWYVYCSQNPVNRIDPLGLNDYSRGYHDPYGGTGGGIWMASAGSSASFSPLGGSHDNVEVGLRAMFNMHRNPGNANDRIDVFDDRIDVYLNGGWATYYYNPTSETRLHGNRLVGKTMMVNAVEFGKHFGLVIHDSDSGTGSYTFMFNYGEGSDEGTLSYSWSYNVSYVNTPNGPVIYRQSASFTMTGWTGKPGADSADLPSLGFSGSSFLNSQGTTVRSSFLYDVSYAADRGLIYRLSHNSFRSDQHIMLPQGTTTAQTIFRVNQGASTTPMHTITVSIGL